MKTIILNKSLALDLQKTIGRTVGHGSYKSVFRYNSTFVMKVSTFQILYEEYDIFTYLNKINGNVPITTYPQKLQNKIQDNMYYTLQEYITGRYFRVRSGMKWYNILYNNRPAMTQRPKLCFNFLRWEYTLRKHRILLEDVQFILTRKNEIKLIDSHFFGQHDIKLKNE